MIYREQLKELIKAEEHAEQEVRAARKARKDAANRHWDAYQAWRKAQNERLECISQMGGKLCAE